MIEHIEPKATADGVAVYCAHDKIVDTFDENGNVRPNKAKSINKIDPAMALIIAHTSALPFQFCLSPAVT